MPKLLLKSMDTLSSRASSATLSLSLRSSSIEEEEVIVGGAGSEEVALSSVPIIPSCELLVEARGSGSGGEDGGEDCGGSGAPSITVLGSCIIRG